MSFDAKHGTMVKLRSQIWFYNPDDPDMTALYIERYMNWGITREELQSGKPIIGIAQTGSDLSPCNRQHVVLAQRVREGIREAGGTTCCRLQGERSEPVCAMPMIGLPDCSSSRVMPQFM